MIFGTSQIFTRFKGWRLLLKGMKEKINNKKALLFMIYAFSLLKLRDETVQNLLKFKGWD